MQEDVVLTLLEGDSRINKVLDKLENEGFCWYTGETPYEGYIPNIHKDVKLYIHWKNKKLTFSDINYIDTSFKDITIDEFLNIFNLSFSSIITSTEPLCIEFKDKNKFKRFIMECYMREDDVFRNVNEVGWSNIFNLLNLPDVMDYLKERVVFLNISINYMDIIFKENNRNIINGDNITYPSVSKETINSIISPIIKDGEVVKNYKEIVDVIAKLKEL